MTFYVESTFEPLIPSNKVTTKRVLDETRIY